MYKHGLFFNKISNLFLSKKQKAKKEENAKTKYNNYNKTEIIDDYLFSIPLKYNSSIYKEREVLNKFLSLKILSKDTDISEAKSNLYNEFKLFSKDNNKNFEDIKIFVTNILRYGNDLIILNNILYYCEVLGFKNIYINSNYKWVIQDKIVTDKYNIIPMPPQNINCNDKNILCIDIQMSGFFYSQAFIKPEIRLNILKNQIKKYLPIVDINPNDLYIHIRSGDIFRANIETYAQPPFCFYQKILDKYQFKKIYIIAIDNLNPVIDKILKDFSNVIFEKRSYSIDMAYIINAYNLVGSVSSFLLNSVKFNDNLKKYFEYDIYRKSEKFYHLHHDFYYFPKNFIIYRMKPSENYKNEMFVLTNEESKYKLMIEEKCIHDFTIIEPNNN